MAKHTTPDRKRLFRAALALNGLTAQGWAAQEGVSNSYLSLILNGYREGGSIGAKIDAYITRHLGKQQAKAS